jgi:hypothetical protein
MNVDHEIGLLKEEMKRLGTPGMCHNYVFVYVSKEYE